MCSISLSNTNPPKGSDEEHFLKNGYVHPLTFSHNHVGSACFVQRQQERLNTFTVRVRIWEHVCVCVYTVHACTTNLCIGMNCDYGMYHTLTSSELAKQRKGNSYSTVLDFSLSPPFLPSFVCSISQSPSSLILSFLLTSRWDCNTMRGICRVHTHVYVEQQQYIMFYKIFLYNNVVNLYPSDCRWEVMTLSA